MPHILSDEQYRELQAYRKCGYSPKQLKTILRDLDLDEPAPLPMMDESQPVTPEQLERFFNEA